MRGLCVLLAVVGCAPAERPLDAPLLGLRSSPGPACLIAPAEPDDLQREALEGMAIALADQPAGWIVHQAHNGDPAGVLEAFERCLAWGRRRVLGPIGAEASALLLTDAMLADRIAMPVLPARPCPPSVRAARPPMGDQGWVAGQHAARLGLQVAVVLSDEAPGRDIAVEGVAEGLGGEVSLGSIAEASPPGDQPRALLLLGSPQQAEARLLDSLGPADHAWLADRAMPSRGLDVPGSLAGRVHGLVAARGPAELDAAWWERHQERAPWTAASGYEAARLLFDESDGPCDDGRGRAHDILPTEDEDGRLGFHGDPH